VARFLIRNGELVLRLSAAEKVAALRRSVRVPLASVRSVEVIERPWRDFLPNELRLGFAAGSAPGRSLITAGPRAKTMDGGEAAVFVYLNRRAVAVWTLGAARPRLLVASTRAPEDDARHILEVIGR
jgi:hypothetical protein